MSLFDSAKPAPRRLLYLATFNRQKRHKIESDEELRAALRSADAAEWPAIYERHTRAHSAVMLPRIAHHERYVEAAINGVVGELSQARVGARNDTLNKAAFRLGQLGVDEEQVKVILAPTASAIGLCVDEIERTVRSAVRAGAANPRGRASR